MRHSTRRRRVRRASSTKKRRGTFGRRRSARRSGGDVHHFKQTVDGGVIGYVAGQSQSTSSGGFVMRLSDLPIYAQMAPNFEFARLNKCKIELIPKYNFQSNSILVSTGALTSISATGTLVTAIDQVPFYSRPAGFGYLLAPSWSLDSSDSSATSSASAVQVPFTTGYVRGLQGSKETELYKKRTISFYPAFYDYVMSAYGSGLPITDITNPGPESNAPTVALTTNGCVERKIKKWVSINSITQEAAGTNFQFNNQGPLYFGPVYALDVNDGSTSGNIPLYDVRFTYSVSFKRVKGV